VEQKPLPLAHNCWKIVQNEVVEVWTHACAIEHCAAITRGSNKSDQLVTKEWLTLVSRLKYKNCSQSAKFDMKFKESLGTYHHCASNNGVRSLEVDKLILNVNLCFSIRIRCYITEITGMPAFLNTILNHKIIFTP